MSKNAKAGDKFTAKAEANLRKLLDATLVAALTYQPVQPKTAGERGQWICIHCGHLFTNNMETYKHPKRHKLAWRNFTSGNIEEP